MKKFRFFENNNKINYNFNKDMLVSSCWKLLKRRFRIDKKTLSFGDKNRNHSAEYTLYSHGFNVIFSF